jgi:hypothetical protein
MAPAVLCHQRVMRRNFFYRSFNSMFGKLGRLASEDFLPTLVALYANTLCHRYRLNFTFKVVVVA